MYQQDLALHVTVAVITVDRSEHGSYDNTADLPKPKLMFQIWFCVLGRRELDPSGRTRKSIF